MSAMRPAVRRGASAKRRVVRRLARRSQRLERGGQGGALLGGEPFELDAALVMETAITFQCLFAPADFGPYDPASEPDPSKGGREIQVTHPPLAHRL